MGLDLNTIATKTAITKVDFMGQSALVTYNPSLLTQENILKAQTGDSGFVEFFTELVKDWDVKRGPKKVPITQKGLETIPLPFLKAVFRTIMKTGSHGDEEEGKASSAG